MTPELALVGYLPRDLLLSAGFVRRSWDHLHKLANDLEGLPPTLVGLPETNPSDEGRPLFNAAVLVRDGRVDLRFRKALLPTYDVFDEDRYFEPFHGAQILEIAGRRLGISICEDVWNDRDFWKRRRYHHDPVEELVRVDATAIINLSASPFAAGKHHRREEMLSSMAHKHRVPIVYVNQFGGNDDLVFDGRSCGFNADGIPIARGRSFDADVVICDIDEGCPIAPLSDDGPESEIWRALVLGTRDYARKCGFPRAVLGLSGGIDSALTAADRRRGARRGSRARRPDAVALLEPRQHRGCSRSWRRIWASRRSRCRSMRRCRRWTRRFAHAFAGTRDGRHRGEHPGAHPRQSADGALEQARRAAPDDREQVGARGRLLHAVRRHVRRAWRSSPTCRRRWSIGSRGG